jgi:hypothetical protein
MQQFVMRVASAHSTLLTANIVSIWIFGGMLAVALVAADSLAPGGRRILKIAGLDSVCYYNMAHSVLFDFDFDLRNQYRKLSPDPEPWVNVQPKTGLPGSPFAVGFSLLEIPFIFMGHLYAIITVGKSDGYCSECVKGFFFGNIFYLCLGMSFLFFFLRSIGRTIGASVVSTEWASCIATFAVWPSTTLAYYTFSPTAHIAAFAACSFFLFTWFKAKETVSAVKWISCGFAGGLLTLVRWEAIVLMSIPLVYELLRVWNNRSFNFGATFQWLRSRSLCALSFFVILIPQFLQWKQIYGSYFVIPQGPDWFVFPGRYIFQVFFSSEHGWFVWTPATLLGISGLMYAWRRIPTICLSFLVGASLYALLVGSTHSWHGIEFGNRYLTTCIPIVAVGIAMYLLAGSPLVKGTVLASGVLLTIYSVVFGVQYRLDIVPKHDRLTFQELVLDKIFLTSAFKRMAAYARARQELNNSNFEGAAVIASEAIKQFGADRNLLHVLIEIYKRSGDSINQKTAERKLQDILKARLW